jgi:6-pyruvoyl-tetrahydropterin synthase-like protein/uncharacterized protein DUF6077
MQGAHIPRRQSAAAIVAIAVASFCALLPWFHYGIPSGHDFEFHFNSWVEVLNHWRQGVIYPHWAALAHYGYGEARFIFYPPASWTLGAALGATLPWKVVPGAYVWLALTLSGTAMFVLARRWLSSSDALFAAILYALNPYHLVIVYWRSAMAELLAAAYLPLLLLCVLRLEEEGGKRMIAPLGLLLAAGWLTNVPSAVMMNYSLGVLVLWIAISRRRWNVLGCAGIAVLAGAALAAIYLVPVLHQRSWASLDQVLAPGVRPDDNFLFIRTTDADHDRFNLLVSVVAACEFLLLALALFFWRARRLAKLWWPLVVWGIACVSLMFSFTLPFWRYLPQLRYVQLPWRWLLAFNVVFALAVVVALQRWWLRVGVCIVALGIVPLVAHRILMPWWDRSTDIREMVDNQHDGIGNEGADEYVPAGVDPYDIDQNAPPAAFKGPGEAKVKIERWAAEKRIIVADATSPGNLALRLFNYPLWQVKVNGTMTQPAADSHGEMQIPLAAGKNRVEINFVEGWDRIAGGAISLAALIGLIFSLFARGPRADDRRPRARSFEPTAGNRFT